MFTEYFMTNPGDLSEYFGFTEQEVFQPLDEFHMAGERETVKL